ncbi:MAG: hypothetical protein SPG64_05875 [Candidatus Enteromonas sp.]|nr:hypothetical protein [Candidatus Enteromonas sp.]
MSLLAILGIGLVAFFVIGSLILMLPTLFKIVGIVLLVAAVIVILVVLANVTV